MFDSFSGNPFKRVSFKGFNIPSISRKLQTLVDVGLSYIKLGQAATTLSGGEAQRVKLSRELSKRDTGRTLYILDEPTTGLHFQDIRQLLSVLHHLRDQGNTIVVIEHNLDVIKTADWIIDLGPEGGTGGGEIIATGTPEKIIKSVDIKIQLGGGVRNFDTIDFWMNAGIKRLIIGTMALKKPELVIEACEKYPGKIALGIDVRDGKIATEGWVEQSQISAVDLVKKFEDVDVSAIIYTDISRDGILMGPALEETLKFSDKTKIPIIISGGVSSEKDIIEIKKRANDKILGVISGRAIYDNRLNVHNCNKILGN